MTGIVGETLDAVSNDCEFNKNVLAFKEDKGNKNIKNVYNI